MVEMTVREQNSIHFYQRNFTKNNYHTYQPYISYKLISEVIQVIRYKSFDIEKIT